MGTALAMTGILLGLLLAPLPGLPGALAALLGLAAYTALTPSTPPWALGVGVVLVLGSLAAQVLAPLSAMRALSAPSLAATGAVVGISVGLVTPLPMASLLLGTLFGVLGGWVGGRGLLARAGLLRAGCVAALVSIAADGLAVLGIAAVFAMLRLG